MPCDQPWTPSKAVGILAQIADNSILTLCQMQELLGHDEPTMSTMVEGRPPSWPCLCKWLDFPERFDFCLQVLTAECPDETVNHGHFKIILQVAKQLGFRWVWSQVTTLNQMSPQMTQMRTCWLATWTRSDLSAKFYDGKITPHATCPAS